MEFIQTWFMGSVCALLGNQPQSTEAFRALLALRLQNTRIKMMADTALVPCVLKSGQRFTNFIVGRDLQGVFIREYSMHTHLKALLSAMYERSGHYRTLELRKARYILMKRKYKVSWLASYELPSFRIWSEEAEAYAIIIRILAYARELDQVTTGLYEAVNAARLCKYPANIYPGAVRLAMLEQTVWNGISLLELE